MLKRLLAISACAFAVSLATDSILQPAVANTDFPITEITLAKADNTSMEGEFLVPDRDTTRPAYGVGSRLRRYDVHVAKMFELTNYQCRQDPGLMRINWQYYANSGNTRMGAFNINCRLAQDIAVAYGLGRSEQTAILKDGRFEEVYDVPTLNIMGANKISKWLSFSQTFRPIK